MNIKISESDYYNMDSRVSSCFITPFESPMGEMDFEFEFFKQKAPQYSNLFALRNRVSGDKRNSGFASLNIMSSFYYFGN